MEDALARVQQQFGKKYPIIIGGEEIHLDDTFESINPARPDEVLGLMSKATPADATRAIEVANEAFNEWKRTPAVERADLLVRVAARLRQLKYDLWAWMAYEVGKTWPEADGEVVEVIDFLEYYARQMIELAENPPSLIQLPGERNTYRYLPLGAGVVIAPWNFPAALMTGMSGAAIVGGNPVVLKPASTSPIIAYQLVKLFLEEGCPPGVLNFITGPGGSIGNALVDHPKTRFIAFTGSKEVGLQIHERAAKVTPGQIWIKRTVLEMGGKNAVVVDETADLEAAAAGIVASAFGYQGQKCSAGSRAIVVQEVYDDLVDRVLTRTQQLNIGDPADLETDLGPIIDANAFQKILDYIEIGTQEGELILGGKTVDINGGYFIQPTIFKDVSPNARLAQEEIFGPVLAFIKAKDFDDALDIANSTEYGLTGSLYSQAPDRIERAAAEFHAGNLYFNRKCTGAIVGAHPFGGFNMSGTDSKAGGPDYLLLFTQPKSVSEQI
jgi:1-pyrroline-5-carboxylate dehydrogenase